jgi:hypothetical protein
LCCSRGDFITRTQHLLLHVYFRQPSTLHFVKPQRHLHTPQVLHPLLKSHELQMGPAYRQFWKPHLFFTRLMSFLTSLQSPHRIRATAAEVEPTKTLTDGYHRGESYLLRGKDRTLFSCSSSSSHLRREYVCISSHLTTKVVLFEQGHACIEGRVGAKLENFSILFIRTRSSLTPLKK